MYIDSQRMCMYIFHIYLSGSLSFICVMCIDTYFKVHFISTFVLYILSCYFTFCSGFIDLLLNMNQINN